MNDRLDKQNQTAQLVDIPHPAHSSFQLPRLTARKGGLWSRAVSALATI